MTSFYIQHHLHFGDAEGLSENHRILYPVSQTVSGESIQTPEQWRA
jgi:hypothetical protein